MESPRDSYYYCPDCKSFHTYGTHDRVNPKLCFVCGKKGTQKARIVFSDSGVTQICDVCKKEYGL